MSYDRSRVGRRPGELDDATKAIIAQLQVHGRRSYAAIGEAVGMSEGATRQRVLRLTEAGVIQVVAVTDPLEMGFGRQAMIGVGVDGDLDGVAASIAQLRQVDYLVVTAGRFDLLVEVVCEDDDQLLQTVSTEIRAIDGVRSTESFVYLKLHKQTFAWGVR